MMRYVDPAAPLSSLSPEQKARLGGSFGGVAPEYARYRPSPPVDAVEWLVPEPVERIVDLGAGTGALTRLLLERAHEVVAVEPDPRMRAVLEADLPAARAVDGRGEAMPVGDRVADAVLASTSWHWMDPVATLHEVNRVLRPHGTLGVLWTGPDPDSALLTQGRAFLTERSGTSPAQGFGGDLTRVMQGAAERPPSTLEIPPGLPFTTPEHQVFTWDVSLTADELIGLLGTFSFVTTLPPDSRERLLADARRLLREVLGVEGDATVDVGFRCDAFRTHPTG